MIFLKTITSWGKELLEKSEAIRNIDMTLTGEETIKRKRIFQILIGKLAINKKHLKPAYLFSFVFFAIIIPALKNAIHVVRSCVK